MTPCATLRVVPLFKGARGNLLLLAWVLLPQASLERRTYEKAARCVSGKSTVIEKSLMSCQGHHSYRRQAEKTLQGRQIKKSINTITPINTSKPQAIAPKSPLLTAVAKYEPNPGNLKSFSHLI